MSRVSEPDKTVNSGGASSDRDAAIPEFEAPAQPISSSENAEWTQLMPPEEWAVYEAAIHAVRATGVRFMLGGAFGLAAHTGRWRNTKDIDFFVLPDQRQTIITALTDIGFTDFHDTLAYDRGWIYRANREGVLVDVIWGTPNRRTEVDSQWFDHAGRIMLRTEEVEVIPAEELLWIKMYVLQRDRCDWPDLINLLYAKSHSLDWERVVQRLGEDRPLLDGLLSVFAWVCPNRIDDIPATFRKKAGVRKPRHALSEPVERRIQLLDTRPWFAAFQPSDRPMRL